MFVKLHRADMCVEFFETEKYLICPVKDIDEIITEIWVYNGRRLYYHWRRPHKKEYTRNYKPKAVIQDQ